MTGIYIHIPFCLRKCSYCDFYSVRYSHRTADDYVNAVIRNLKRYNVKADTVYFGGGTPSLLSAEQIDRILNAADISPNAEISLECNPKTVDIQKISDYRSAGINRLSIGIQSLNDTELSAAGRLHNAADAVNTVLAAYKAGITNLSADLMLGLPFQTAASLENTLRDITKLPLRHISAYMLKIEENTPLAADRSLLANTADDDTLADMYDLTCEHLKTAGLYRYEISNFSVCGYECRHNLKYWHCEDYIGIGPAAHSCYKGRRYAVPRDIGQFIADEYQREEITDTAPCTEEERLMLGLRLSEGINTADYSAPAKLMKKAEPLEKGGFVTINTGIIALTDKGFPVSNEIICRLI
jgi:oxygen-independent coproporphyrinogen-3 oxidase